MKVSAQQLRQRYSELPDFELVELNRKSRDLTETAQDALAAELLLRNIDPNTWEESSPKAAALLSEEMSRPKQDYTIDLALKAQYESMTIEELHKIRANAFLVRDASITLDAVINDKLGITAPAVVFSRGPVTVTARTLLVGDKTIPLSDIGGPLLQDRAEPPWYYSLVVFPFVVFSGLNVYAATGTSWFGIGACLLALYSSRLVGQRMFDRVQLMIRLTSAKGVVQLLVTKDPELIRGLEDALANARKMESEPFSVGKQ